MADGDIEGGIQVAKQRLDGKIAQAKGITAPAAGRQSLGQMGIQSAMAAVPPSYDTPATRQTGNPGQLGIVGALDRTQASYDTPPAQRYQPPVPQTPPGPSLQPPQRIQPVPVGTSSAQPQPQPQPQPQRQAQGLAARLAAPETQQQVGIQAAQAGERVGQQIRQGIDTVSDGAQRAGYLIGKGMDNAGPFIERAMARVGAGAGDIYDSLTGGNQAQAAEAPAQPATTVQSQGQSAAQQQPAAPAPITQVDPQSRNPLDMTPEEQRQRMRANNQQAQQAVGNAVGQAWTSMTAPVQALADGVTFTDEPLDLRTEGDIANYQQRQQQRQADEDRAQREQYMRDNPLPTPAPFPQQGQERIGIQARADQVTQQAAEQMGAQAVTPTEYQPAPPQTLQSPPTPGRPGSSPAVTPAEQQPAEEAGQAGADQPDTAEATAQEAGQAGNWTNLRGYQGIVGRMGENGVPEFSNQPSAIQAAAGTQPGQVGTVGDGRGGFVMGNGGPGWAENTAGLSGINTQINQLRRGQMDSGYGRGIGEFGGVYIPPPSNPTNEEIMQFRMEQAQRRSQRDDAEQQSRQQYRTGQLDNQQQRLGIQTQQLGIQAQQAQNTQQYQQGMLRNQTDANRINAIKAQAALNTSQGRKAGDQLKQLEADAINRVYAARQAGDQAAETQAMRDLEMVRTPLSDRVQPLKTETMDGSTQELVDPLDQFYPQAGQQQPQQQQFQPPAGQYAMPASQAPAGFKPEVGQVFVDAKGVQSTFVGYGPNRELIFEDDPRFAQQQPATAPGA